MALRRGTYSGLEYREDGPEELPELIHEVEDGEAPPSCADSAEEELPELIASDEEETRAMWIGDGDDDELPEIICHEGSGEIEGGRRPGDVSAMRVVLLGVSDGGTPSVGIDLGLACPANADGMDDGESCYTMYNECFLPRGSALDGADDVADLRDGDFSDDGEELAYEGQSGLGTDGDAAFESRRMIRLGSPFAFQPPVAPSSTTISFGIGASSGYKPLPPRQPFVFGFGKGGYIPPPSQEFISAIDNPAFVQSVLSNLPGVDATDPKVLERLKKLRVRMVKPEMSIAQTMGKSNAEFNRMAKIDSSDKPTDVPFKRSTAPSHRDEKPGVPRIPFHP